MNGAERARISLIVTHEVDLARRAYTQGRSEIYGKHAAAGRLQSGSTVKAVVAVIRETLINQVALLDGKIRAIVSDRDALANILTWGIGHKYGT